MNSRHKVVAVVALAAMVVSPTLIAADAPVLAVATCASPLAPVKVTAQIPANATGARVYFKGPGPEYYVDMRPGTNGAMWAFIPAPELTTKTITYRVVSTDARGQQVSTPAVTLNTSASCPAQSLTAAEQQASSNMIVGLTNSSESPVPVGFLCRGIVSYITADGVLRPNDECRRIAALNGPAATTNTVATNGANAAAGAAEHGGAAAAGGAAAGAGGLSAGTITALTVVGLTAAGVAIYQHNHGKHKGQVSPSRP